MDNIIKKVEEVFSSLKEKRLIGDFHIYQIDIHTFEVFLLDENIKLPYSYIGLSNFADNDIYLAIETDVMMSIEDKIIETVYDMLKSTV